MTTTSGHTVIEWQGMIYAWVGAKLFKFEGDHSVGWVEIDALPSGIVHTNEGLFPKESEQGREWLEKQEPHKCRCPKDRPLLWYGCQCGGV